MWAREPQVVWRRTATGAVLRRTDSEEYVVLDAPGSALWDAMEQARSSLALAEALALQFDADAEALLADVEHALVDLQSRGLATTVAR